MLRLNLYCAAIERQVDIFYQLGSRETVAVIEGEIAQFVC
jgi:hypothetical protein